MQYCFHHIPKTAGSSLQLRLSHRESIGELPKGSTLVVYPLYDEMRFYRVSQDQGFDSGESIKQAFLRTYKHQATDGNATIVMGHYTNITQPGKHYTWLRHPLHRDISHFNYDSKFNNQLDDNFETHLSMMNGNFMTIWLYGKYCGLHDSVTMEHRYNHVRKVLKENFVKVFDSDKFEDSWIEIAKMLNVSVEPRQNSNVSVKDYKKLVSYKELDDKFKAWHQSYNTYDYKLFDEFCL